MQSVRLVSNCSAMLGLSQNGSRVYETWVQRSAERMLALEVAMKATDRRNAELEARVASLTRTLHQSEIRMQADQEEKDILMATIRALKTQSTLTGAESSVHQAAVSLGRMLSASADVLVNEDDAPHDWQEIESQLVRLLSEVREVINKNALMKPGAVTVSSGLDPLPQPQAFTAHASSADILRKPSLYHAQRPSSRKLSQEPGAGDEAAVGSSEQSHASNGGAERAGTLHGEGGGLHALL